MPGTRRLASAAGVPGMTRLTLLSSMVSPSMNTLVNSTKGSAMFIAGPASMTRKRCHTGFFMKSCSGGTQLSASSSPKGSAPAICT